MYNVLYPKVMLLVIGSFFTAIALSGQVDPPGVKRVVEVSGASLSPRPLPLYVAEGRDYQPLQWSSLTFAAPLKLTVTDNELPIYFKRELTDPETKTTTTRYDEVVRLTIPADERRVLALLWPRQGGLGGMVISSDSRTFPMESFYVINASNGHLAARISGSETMLMPGESRIFQGRADFSSNDGPINIDPETGDATYTQAFDVPVNMSSVLVTIKRQEDENWLRPLNMRWQITPNRRQVVLFYFNQNDEFTFSRVVDQPR